MFTPGGFVSYASLCAFFSHTERKKKLKKVQLSEKKRLTSGAFLTTDQSQAEHLHFDTKETPNCQNKKQWRTNHLGKVLVERLMVLITEHVEIYDMSNRLYHNTHHKGSIWKQIGLILPICHFVCSRRVTSGSRVGSLLGDRKNALGAFRTKSAASSFLLKKQSAQLFPITKNARCEHALRNTNSSK